MNIHGIRQFNQDSGVEGRKYKLFRFVPVWLIVASQPSPDDPEIWYTFRAKSDQVAPADSWLLSALTGEVSMGVVQHYADRFPYTLTHMGGAGVVSREYTSTGLWVSPPVRSAILSRIGR